MKIKFTAYILASLLLCSARVSGFSMSPKESINKAYINGDMKSWHKIIDSLHLKSDKTTKEEFELLNYEYGYIGWSLSGKNKKNAKEYIKRFDERLLRLAQTNENPGLLLAYRAAYYGFEIGLNELKAPFLGKESLKAAEKSVKTDPDNWLGFVLLGNIDFYKPLVFGGSKKEALKYYLKAEEKISGSDFEKSWNHLALLVQIATNYEIIENIEQAEAYYLKSLKIAPEFKWVRDELYVNFKKKHNIK